MGPNLNLNKAMRYRVYKSSIDTYRVWDAQTGQFVTDSAQFLVLKNARPMVDIKRYEHAKTLGFANSGDPLDYFAWLECDGFEIKREPQVFQRISNVLFYNPFKHHLFRDKSTGIVFGKFSRFDHVLIEGNQLRYTNVSKAWIR